MEDAMAKKKKGMKKRELFREGVYALSAHVRRAIDITRQDHPLAEVQNLCRGMDDLMRAAENAADLGYSLEVIAAYQPLLPGMDEVAQQEEPKTDYYGDPIDPDLPF
jgi:hypothetical protein